MVTKEELKNYCRKNNIKGFSNKSKNELEKFVEKHKISYQKTDLGKYKKFLKIFNEYVLDKEEGKIEAGHFRKLVSENVVRIGGEILFYLDELEEKGLIHIYKKTRGYPRLEAPLYPEPWRLYYIRIKRNNFSHYFDNEGNYRKNL